VRPKKRCHPELVEGPLISSGRQASTLRDPVFDARKFSKGNKVEEASRLLSKPLPQTLDGAVTYPRGWACDARMILEVLRQPQDDRAIFSMRRSAACSSATRKRRSDQGYCCERTFM
jgi:hypothetical protein